MDVLFMNDAEARNVRNPDDLRVPFSIRILRASYPTMFEMVATRLKGHAIKHTGEARVLIYSLLAQLRLVREQF